MIKRVPLISLYPEAKTLPDRIMHHIKAISNFKANEIADFSDTLFVLPSQEAGRLFREKAAVFFKEHGGVMSMNTILPEQLLFNPAQINCNQALQLSYWMEVIHDTAPCSLESGLLPEIEFNEENLVSLAASMAETRENILLESGMDSKTFLKTLPEDSITAGKVRDFTILEEKYLQKLNSKYDKAALIQKTFSNPQENFRNIRRIILTECIELKNGIFTILEKISDTIEVEICLNTRSETLELFNISGCPETGKLLTSDNGYFLQETFRTFPSPLQEAMQIASLLDKDNLPDSIGVLNNDLAMPLTHLLSEKNIEVYSPGKRPLTTFYWYKLFNNLLNLRNKIIPYEDVYFWATDDSFNSFAGTDSTILRTIIEKLQREHLIQNFDSLQFFCNKYASEDNNCKNAENFRQCAIFCSTLAGIQQEIRNLDGNSLPESLWNVFTKIAQCNNLEFMDINSSESSLEALKNIIVQLRSAASDTLKMPVFRYLCNSTNIRDAEVFKDNAVNFSGFLDLIWYENKSLIIGGFTEEAFASSRQEDIIFPEHVRRQLNWSSAWSRFGADIHRFKTLVETYAPDKLFITFAAADIKGALNTLPRLLFTVNDKLLLEYCDLLFNSKLTGKINLENENSASRLKYSSSFHGAMPERISVTGFKNYISCPYTFYLRNILNKEEQGAELFELQPEQSGTIIHNVLEQYGRKFTSVIPDREDLNKFIITEFEKQLHAVIGYSINNIAVMQAAEIKKSLEAFINCELAYRQSFKKHEILCSEYKMNVNFAQLHSRIPAQWQEKLPAPPEEILKINIVGKIDRIDICNGNDDLTVCNIIDYKSAKKPQSPADAHLNKKCPVHLSGKSIFAGYDKRGNELYFKDMQLVIYKLLAQFMREELNIPSDIPINCGYFNLPEDISETSIEFFAELDDEMLFAGFAALQYLLTEIFSEKNFWPPSFEDKYGIAGTYFPECDSGDFDIQEVANG